MGADSLHASFRYFCFLHFTDQFHCPCLKLRLYRLPTEVRENNRWKQFKKDPDLQRRLYLCNPAMPWLVTRRDVEKCRHRVVRVESESWHWRSHGNKHLISGQIKEIQTRCKTELILGVMRAMKQYVT